jgi:hypothetical protein
VGVAAIVELSWGFGVILNMKDEDASRIASSLDRIATGLDKLNELLQRKTQAAKARIPKWALVIGTIVAVVLIWSMVKTGHH